MITRLGTDYGGHSIELSLLNKESIVYSAGIGTDISFDKAVIEQTECIVHAFDPTTKSIAWVQNQPKLQNFYFYDIGISDFNGIATFEPPAVESHVSFKESATGNYKFLVKKLSTIMNKLKHNVVDCLKLDIEGSEYGVLSDIIDENINVKQICLEFHGRSESEIKDFLENIKFFDIYNQANKERLDYLFIRK